VNSESIFKNDTFNIARSSTDQTNMSQNNWELNSNESNDSAFYEPNEMGIFKNLSNPNSPKKMPYRQQSSIDTQRVGSGVYEMNLKNSSELTRIELENEIM